MLQHALQMPELDRWRLSTGRSPGPFVQASSLQGPASDVYVTDELRSFLLASRAAYNAFVHYHNFRHVIDVMQATFYFLLQVGTLPSYPGSPEPPGNHPVSPIAALLKPFDALTLLISAIGHDVGHPGVNNAFLVALNAPWRSYTTTNLCLNLSIAQRTRRYFGVTGRQPSKTLVCGAC